MPRTGWERALERFAASRAGGWYFINVANKVDKHLVPATRGKVSTAIGQQVLVVETIGAVRPLPRAGGHRRAPDPGNGAGARQRLTTASP